MRQTDIDLTEAVEAAARGYCDDLVPAVTIDDLSAIQRHVIREQALSYVTHAAPHIERQVREQVAREIEARLPAALVADIHSDEGWASDMQYARPHTYDGEWVGFCGQGSIDVLHISEYAARIARGEQP